jgi:hypothetical protein
MAGLRWRAGTSFTVTPAHLLRQRDQGIGSIENVAPGLGTPPSSIQTATGGHLFSSTPFPALPVALQQHAEDDSREDRTNDVVSRHRFNQPRIEH